MENAQTLRLYAPRLAKPGRRFSRFDRGTSAQQNGEPYVAASAQQNDERYSNYNVSPNAPMAPFGHAPARSSASLAARPSRDRPPDQPGQQSPAKASS
jgi:hypothetical protein